ncbi:hypothetical protein BKK79_16840 [Cupriavidus sp. USMAA2-4]|uniref:Preprotein translocase subunit SecA n=1 Tax=Cupriavidus malaysiensis TaxID=367825 RepID=A0ABN4TR24_9BURK|nr:MULTISPECIES: hypothetical protein [Cupriavidus]AOY93283.1 hypothetical protein BKK79_16840 [Cupriavidus sp. USMAA2-4]AOZ00425.1 hypothetical protein BKK81_15160 [Cupriavidus sp. USMAHM13]AOZ07171.1 hypothetical protein BKK80_16110 [Cupriavidus malaysiensis]
MLSAHELAALMIVDSTHDHRQLNPVDLQTLVDRKLVSLERDTGSSRRPRLTHCGRRVLDVVARAA